jgi:peptidoglycan hydrolase-like protein with peptidoglycan-binding domain
MSAKRAKPGPKAPFGFMQAGLVGAALAGLARIGISIFARSATIFAFAMGPVVRRVRKAPLSSAAIAVVALGYGWATVNALMWQTPPADFHPHRTPVATTGTDNAPGSYADIPTAPPVRPARFEIAAPQQEPSAAEQILASGQIVGNRDTFVVQTLLARLGYFSARIDGLYGPITAKAIRAFEAAAGADVHGKLTPELVKLLDAAAGSGAFGAPQRVPSDAPAPAVMVADAPVANALDTLAQSAQVRVAKTAQLPDPVPAAPVEVARIEIAGLQDTQSQASQNQVMAEEELVRLIQRGLASLGYKIGAIDGVAGEVTKREIRRFETFQSLQPTGAISPDLVDLLRNANAAI